MLGHFARFVYVTVAVTSLSSCAANSVGAGGTSVPSSPVEQFASIRVADPAKTTSTIFAVDQNERVDAFDFNGNRLYSMSNFSSPFGLATDTMGRLYVLNDTTITVVANPPNGPQHVLQNPGQVGYSVAVSSSNQMVAAMNLDAPSNRPGSVTLFRAGATTACATVGNPKDFSRVEYGAFDAEGNLFVEGSDAQGHARIGEVSGGCSATTIQHLLTDDTAIGAPGGIAVNKMDQVVAGGQRGLFTFARPVNGSLGAPLIETSLGGTQVMGFALTGDGKYVWTTGVNFQTKEYSYPAGGLPVRSYTLQVNPLQIAVSPVEVP